MSVMNSGDRSEHTGTPEATLEEQVGHWAQRRLELAYHEYSSGLRYNEDDWERVDAGERLAELAEQLGTERVEAIVRSVEQRWADSVREEDWRLFSAAIVTESYEGRYPGWPSAFDFYRAPHLGAEGRPNARW